MTDAACVPGAPGPGFVTASVAWIAIAPVKGLGLVQPPAVELTKDGVTANRAFYLIDPDGRMLNGKRLGSLVTVSPAYDEGLGALSLTFPDGKVVRGEVALGQEVTTSFFGRAVSGRVVEGPWGEALSTHAGLSLKLVRVTRAGDGVDRGSRASVSMLSTGSLARLGEALGLGSGLDHRRFRMLFGVAGVGAHAEDGWSGHRVRLGEAVVDVIGKVGRCLVTTQDPDTGVPNLNTLGALRSYRRAETSEAPASEKLCFGVWGHPAEPGRVGLGDPVELL